MKTQNQANHYKWPIPSGRLAPEPISWEEHEDYNAIVFSATSDPSLCETLIAGIPDSSKTQVLIPGCGSLIELQKKLLEACPNIGQVCCTDFSSKAIERAETSWLQYAAQSNLSSNLVSFEKLDSTQLTELKPDWRNQFDCVLVVNSVLSSKDEDNRKMLGEFYKVLKPGGKLYGLFPTVFCKLEIVHLVKSEAYRLIDGSIDVFHSSIYEEKQNRHQIFYTPLRLNRIFKEAGFKRLRFEVYFCDSKYFNTKAIYGYDDPDICIWEFLVQLEKEKT